MGKYLPRVVNKEKCHPNVPSACCSGRYSAIKRGEFYYDFGRGGWVSLLNPLRSMRDWEVVWRAGENTNGEPYLLEICPFCGCALPELPAPIMGKE